MTSPAHAPEHADPPGSLPPSLPSEGPRASAWRRAATPAWVSVGPARLLVALMALLVPIGLLPWQQSAPGAGRVIAYDPADRPQTVDAPVAGRVLAWRVREGQRVHAGDVIVELQDNDPGFVERLLSERHLLLARFEASQSKVEASEAKREAMKQTLAAQLTSAEAKIRAAEDKLRAEREALIGEEAAARTAEVQEARARTLFQEGLRSEQSLEDYALKADTAAAKLESARAKVSLIENELAGARADLEKVRNDAQGKIAEADSDLQSSLGSARDDEAKILKLDTQLARQDTRLVTAPIDGFVARIYGGQGGAQVKPQDELALIVPDTQDRAVEIWLDGNDVALVQQGEEVRLQFEGWPALQFSGWPSVAIGTFAGVVDFIDATDDGKGRFRVFVVPDPNGEPWPDAHRLRQGVRARGWVMLGTVRLAFEAWRQLNDFPPALPEPGEKDGAKPVGGPADADEASKAGKSWRPK